MQSKYESEFGILGSDAKERLNNDNDIKIIIQGADSQTGIGKTTLAIQLCRYIDDNGWSAKDKAYIDTKEYLNDFLSIEPKSALLLDEIGAGADSRRAMSSENVDLSQGWQMLRARNVATVATLPSTNMLDHRMLELADWWVLVKRRGLAQPYEIHVNDFNGKISRDPAAGEQHIQFEDLPSRDPDKKYLDEIKDNKIESGGMETIKMAEHKKELREAKEDARKEYRDELITKFYNNTNLSYADIGDVVELTKQTVGQIVRSD